VASSNLCRGVRGATTIPENTREALLDGTKELLRELIDRNGIEQDAVASVFFSITADLNTEYPAVAARQLGWTETALFCGQEMAIAGSLARCVRVLIHWNTTLAQSEIQHVYLRDAVTLRPDRALPKQN